MSTPGAQNTELVNSSSAPIIGPMTHVKASNQKELEIVYIRAKYNLDLQFQRDGHVRDLQIKQLEVCILGVSPSLVSSYCEVYSFWGI